VTGQQPGTIYKQEWETLRSSAYLPDIPSKSKLATTRATPLAAATTLIKAFKVTTLFIPTHADLKLY
jgi:hypothetical protein